VRGREGGGPQVHQVTGCNQDTAKRMMQAGKRFIKRGAGAGGPTLRMVHGSCSTLCQRSQEEQRLVA
jgi:hypothetical protein